MRLTTDPAYDFNPAWSPDGKYITFLREVPTAPQFRVFIVPALGGTERQIAEVDSVWFSWSFWKLAWSPDNKWLVVGDGNGEGRPYGLHLISVETGEKRKYHLSSTWCWGWGGMFLPGWPFSGLYQDG